MEPQVSATHYFKKRYFDVARFISYFYQIELARRYAAGSEGNVLEVGVGNQTVSDYLKKTGLRVTTCDIDPALHPDRVADVRRLPFPDGAFDLAMACEVLEHLPFEDFETALRELARVSRGWVIISLPYRSTGFEVLLKFPFVRTILRKPYLDFFFRLPLPFRRPSATSQHHWEIDLWRYRLGRIRAVLRKYFKIAEEVRPILHSYHHFFVLRKHNMS